MTRLRYLRSCNL